MRGNYHEQLIEVLERARKAKLFTQESLAADLDADQTTVGKKLRGTGGTFDLDEADTALRHIGSDLKAFVEHGASTPVKAGPLEWLQRLSKLEVFNTFITALAAAPPDRQRVVLDRLTPVALELVRRPAGGPSGARARGASRTKVARGKRR